jgi:hypothetical protein
LLDLLLLGPLLLRSLGPGLLPRLLRCGLLLGRGLLIG